MKNDTNEMKEISSTSKEQTSRKAPKVDVGSVRIYPCAAQLGNEGPDDEFVYYNDEGAASYLGFKETYGFRFEIYFDTDADRKGSVQTAFTGPVSIDIRSADEKTRGSYSAYAAPCRLVRQAGAGPACADASYLFTTEYSEEAENLFENIYANAVGTFDLQGFLVANEDCGVHCHISAPFRMVNGEAVIGRDELKLETSSAVPLGELLKQ